MLAVSLDNLIFLLLIAVAALFQLLSKAISKSAKTDSNKTSSTPKPQTPRPIQRTSPESDADRIRKFLEALGQPPSSTPPPTVVPRTEIPPRPLAPVQPPPVIIPRAWRLPQEQREKTGNAPSKQPSRSQQIVPPPVPPMPTAAFEVHEALPVELQQPITKSSIETYGAASRSVAKDTGLKADIGILLASKSGLREGIILREIFGPPRGLEAFDLL